MTPVLYHKPFKGASHGDRYRYEITSETLKEVRWLRSDGLEWDAQARVDKAARPVDEAGRQG